MPIGGSNIAWDPSTPSDGESASLGDDRIRSLKTSVQEAMGNEHNWSSAGGANTGYHLPGSCRPFFGLQSAVSSVGSDGRTMWASDTSNYFHAGSGGTSLIGGPRVISAGSYPGGAPPQRHYWAQEFGWARTASNGSVTVTIPNSGYSGSPFVQLTAQKIPVGGGSDEFLAVALAEAPSATQFIAYAWGGSFLAFLSGITIYWSSIGSRVL